MECPIFEFHAPDGNVFNVYEDGTAIGFPDGVVVVNRAKPLLDSLRSWKEQFPASLVTGQQSKAAVS